MSFDHNMHPARPPPRRSFFYVDFTKAEVNFIAKKENFLTISVPFPDEKSQALTLFLEKSGDSLERCMVESIEQLYRKTVPIAIRKYIDATLKKPPSEGEQGAQPPQGF